MLRPFRPHSRSLVVTLALVLAIPGAILLTGTGTSQSCVEDETLRNNPLFITGVTADSRDLADDSVITDEGAIFVEDGDHLKFTVKVRNRMDDLCQDLYSPSDASHLRVQIRYIYDPAEDPQIDETSVQCRDLDEDASCSIGVDLPFNPNGERAVYTTNNYPEGEQRVRLIVQDRESDGSWEDRAGAERVIVANVKPDLSLDSTSSDPPIEWTSPNLGDRHTRYSGSGTTEFRTEMINEGSYPLWNPNGGVDYANRSSYDSRIDGDLAPDEAFSVYYHFADKELMQSNEVKSEVGPECHWASDNDGQVDSSEFPCSYRRGQILDVPVSWEVRKDTSDGLGDIREQGVSDAAVWSDEVDDNHDKDDSKAIAWRGASADDPGLSQSDYVIAKNVTFNSLSLREKAGDFELRVILDRDTDGESRTPEPTDNNNDGDLDIEIKGADLRVTKHGILVEGTTKTCTDPKDPCPAGSRVLIDPAYRNKGHDFPADHEVLQRTWRGAVFLEVGSGEFTVPTDAGGNETRTENRTIPQPGETKSLRSGGWRIPTDNEGGKHTFMITLDDPEIYGEDTNLLGEGRGRVAELRDDTGLPCPSDQNGNNRVIGDEADNTFCLTLYFKDITDPAIEDKAIDDTAQGDGEVPSIVEGEAGNFSATVSDNALEDVKAVFNHTSGAYSIQTDMEPAGQKDRYAIVTDLSSVLGNEDNLGRWTFQVNASDANNTAWSTPMEFDLVELPKTVTDGTQDGDDRLNGDTNVRGSEAPRYQGTADEPENTFQLVVNVTGSGQDDSTEGKFLEIQRPDGTVNKSVQMQKVTACMSDPTVPTEDRSVTTDCDGQPEEDKWTWWEVDSDDPAFEDENIQLEWVGEFDLVVNVTDKFGRIGKENFTYELRDRLNHDTNNEEQPFVPEDEIEFSPTALDPGETTGVRAIARDILRVERVYLDVVHSDTGETFEQDLRLTKPGEAATNNGTYRGSFEAGDGGELFARAGTYEVELVAQDFGNNPTTRDLGTLTVNDTDDPSIESLTTEPQDTVEAGQEVEFFARISDQTQIQPPTLTVTQASAGENVTDLVFNETTGLWELEAPMVATLAAEGTWTYTLEVADYAGHTVTESGEIEVVANNAPSARDWKPAFGTGQTNYGPAQPTIQTDLVDTQGVNRSSITMTVNGETVLEEEEGPASIEAIPGTCAQCYRVSYTPSEAYGAGEVVTVKVTAADLSDPPKESGQQTHQFEVDKTGPSATIDLTPSLSNGNQRIIGSTTDVNVSTSDTGSGPGPARVTVEHLAGTTAATRDVLEIEDGQDSFRLPELDAFQGHGRYRIIVEPTDAVGNEGDSVQKIVLFDDAPPKIQQIPQLNKPRSFIGANVTDVSRVRDVSVKFTADDGPQRQIALELTNGTWSGRIVNPETDQPYPENTTIEFFLQASDFWGNTVTTNRTSFEAGNAVPTIEIDKPERGATLEGTVEIRWTAQDAETSSSDLKISIWYKQGDGKPREIPGAKDIQNTGSYQLDTTLVPNGDITLQTIVFDGSTFGSDTVDVTVQNLGKAFRSPEVRGADTVDGENVLAPGEETLFTVEIDGNVRAAWANVTNEDGETVASYDLEQADGGTWQASFSAPDEPGEYSVDLAALTADGPQKTQDAYTFSVQDQEQTESFIPEWTILSVLFAGAVALGSFGLARRWE